METFPSGFPAFFEQKAALAYMRSPGRSDLRLHLCLHRRKAMSQRRSVHSAGSPSKTPEPTTGANPDGRTPAELPSKPAKKKAGDAVPRSQSAKRQP
ncbi:hypothetical protein [Variovorax paradoxus]|jgi:hypothetical protein|uniref:hypothetical protein n=1 Tax=Variovorax paradoxus TaxID=34073 RepID=UPI003391D3A1